MTSAPAPSPPRIACPADLSRATRHHFRRVRLVRVLSLLAVIGVVGGLASISRALSGAEPRVALAFAGASASVAAVAAAAALVARSSLANRSRRDFEAFRSAGWIAEQVPLGVGDVRGAPIAILTHALLDRGDAHESANRIRRRLDELSPTARRVTAHRLGRLAETGRPVAGEVPELPGSTLLAPLIADAGPVLVIPGARKSDRTRVLPCRPR